MRVVFDSNIFVSALIFPGSRASDAMDRVILGDDVLILSPAIIDEILTVLAAKFERDKEEISRTAVLLSDLGTVVHPAHRLSILKDEPDNRILECAVVGKAEAIITGDKAMLQRNNYSGIDILSLKDYLER